MAVQSEARAEFADQVNVFAEVQGFVEATDRQEFFARRDEAHAASHAQRRLAEEKAEIEREVADFARETAIDREKPRTGDGKRKGLIAARDLFEKSRRRRVVAVEKNQQFACCCARSSVPLPRGAAFALQKRCTRK